jgi:antitoxin (DNA-binding transcriptional repressor) of toxin-antitoxin stability system
MTVRVEHAQLSLKELITKSSLGEQVVITQDEKAVAELRAVPKQQPMPIFGSCKGMLNIVSEDEDHLADFAQYMK